MFGYIRPLKSELNENEQKAFNAVYCGFCRSMGSSGALLRLSLSYDFTFYCLLALSLKDEFCGFDTCRCPVKLCGKRTCVKNCAELSYGADLALLLLYGKLCDNISDRDGALLSRLVLLYVKPKYEKAKDRLKKESEALKNYLETQQNAEKSKASLDACAHGTAELLSLFFGALSEKEEQKEILSRLGYVLGRWVYILDAADDLEGDIKKGRFNPLIQGDSLSQEKIEQIKKDCEMDLNICISEAQDAFMSLNLKHFKPIIENIIFKGLKNSQTVCLKYKNKRERKKAYSGKSI